MHERQYESNYDPRCDDRQGNANGGGKRACTMDDCCTLEVLIRAAEACRGVDYHERNAGDSMRTRKSE